MRVWVTESGAFDYVDTDSSADAELAKSVAGQLSSWLFIPRIKHGQPVEELVVMPFKF